MTHLQQQSFHINTKHVYNLYSNHTKNEKNFIMGTNKKKEKNQRPPSILYTGFILFSITLGPQTYFSCQRQMRRQPCLLEQHVHVFGLKEGSWKTGKTRYLRGCGGYDANHHSTALPGPFHFISFSLQHKRLKFLRERRYVWPEGCGRSTNHHQSFCLHKYGSAWCRKWFIMMLLMMAVT